MHIATGVTRPSVFVAVTLLLGCSLLALTRPVFGYDAWWYHLPFSSFLWNIGGGAASFHLDPFLTERWRGFPKTWEWIQGFAWAATGTLYAVIVPQLLLCMVYFIYVSRTYCIPMTWVILAFFASPMLFIHFQATYLDLPAAICIALGFFLLFDLLGDVRTAGRAVARMKTVAAIASIGLAGNIKYQGLFGCLCVSAVVALLCLLTRGISTKRRVTLLAGLLFADLLASASALSNLAVYGNPFYPVQAKVLGATVFDGPETSEYWGIPTYRLKGSREISLPGPLTFILSATELDWSIRGVVPWYNVDNRAGDSPRLGTPGRTGGWGGLFVIANGWLLALQLFRLRREPDRQQRLLVVGSLLLIVVTACLPHAFELRYYMYIPLVLIPVNLRYLSMQDCGAIVPGALVVLTAYGMAQTVLSRGSELLAPRRWASVAELRAETPPEIVQALHETGHYCNPNVFFRYSSAVTGRPGLLSAVATDCRDAPP